MKPYTEEINFLPASVHASAIARVKSVCEDISRDTCAFELPSSSLTNGSPCSALLMASSAVAFNETRLADSAHALLGNALDFLDQRVLPFFYGGPGVIWSALKVDELLETDDCAGIATDYDDVLIESLPLEELWPAHFDVISGLAGIGIYALERAQQPRGPELIKRTLHHLSSLAVQDADFLYWPTKPHMMPTSPLWGRLNQTVVADIGMAHGNAGVVALLAKIVKSGVHAELAEPMLERSVNWLLAQKNRDSSMGAFPNIVNDPAPSRGAWCYGDFGVANAILLAGQSLSSSKLLDEGLGIIHGACLRSTESLAISNPWLCHGFSGLAHLLHRMHNTFGIDLHKSMSARLFKEALATEDSYLATASQEERVQWSFLEGRIGNSLAYLDACTEASVRWDAPFLII
jgi:lantibiotic biosynthesis protein